MSVLLVDDDDLVRECRGFLLPDEGFRVTEAARAEQALAAVGAGGAARGGVGARAFRGGRGGVLVTDLHFRSGMSGLDLIAAVRRRRPPVPW